MAMLQIKVRLGNKGKTVQSAASLVRVGKSPACEVVLPFPWLQDVHLAVENTGQVLRVKLEDKQGRAELGGKALNSDWTLLPSPSRLVIPAPKGYSLLLDVACIDTSLNVMILRESGGAATGTAAMENIPVDVATRARFDTGESRAEFLTEDLGSETLTSNGENFTRSQRVSIVMASVLSVLMVVGGLGINRIRDGFVQQKLQADTDFVDQHIVLAKDLIARKDYRGAHLALSAAWPVLQNNKAMTAQLAEVQQLDSSSEIRLGGMGYVEMDGRWLPPNQANQWKLVRERDDPKIAELEQQANVAAAGPEI